MQEKRSPGGPVAARGASIAASGAGELILLVDDEEGIRTITRRMLEKHGYRVLTACDGREAIAVFDVHAPRIAAMVTDLMMPDIDGLSAVRQLFRRHPRVPVILTSGFTDRVDVANLGRESIYFLPKPYLTEQLLGLLQEVLASGDRRPA